jgi:hypothetical protein
MRLIVALIVWAGAVVAAIALSSAVASSIHTTPGSGGGGSGGDASAITAAQSASLFRTANLTKALAAAKTALGADAQVENFALYPGYLSITAAKPGEEIDYYVNSYGNQNTTTSSIDTPPDGVFPLSRVTASAPAAIAKRIAAKAHVPTSQLHYMVAEADPVTGQFEWLVYTVGGGPVEYFQVAGNGNGQLSAEGPNGLQPVG